MNAHATPWDEYARLFSAITSRYQQQMYELAASHLSGSVIDCGCGAAKLLPYLVATGRTSAYLGIDSSPEMIACADRVVDRFPGFAARVETRAIEDAAGTFDAAVSLQSYYSWSGTAAILGRIRNLVDKSGTFVLATANDRLDIERLLDTASRELLMHPDWSEYARLNRAFAGDGDARFVTLDELVRESRAAGFRVREAHTGLYDGGLSFLVPGRVNHLVDVTGHCAAPARAAVDAEAAVTVVGFLSELEASPSPEAAFGHLADAVESLGFGAVVYTAIPLSLGAAARLSPVFLASESFSTGFLAHYEQAGLAARDFTIERALAGNTEPLDWHEERARGGLGAEQREVIDIARADYAIRSALSIPTRSDRHVIAGASVACDEPAERFGVLKAERLGALRTIVRAFHHRTFQLPAMQRRFYADFLEPLTDDERCVIRLLVEGHRLKSSADLCGISSTRAGNLRSSLYRRLGVGNASELAYLVGAHGVDRLL